MLTWQDATIHAGEDAAIEFILRDEHGTVLDDTGIEALVWTIASHPGAVPIYSTADITYQQEPGTWRLALARSVTRDLPTGAFYHELAGVRGGARVTLASGILYIRPSSALSML